MKKLFFIIVLTSLVGFPVIAGTFGIGGMFGVNNAWGAGSGWSDFLDTAYDSGGKSLMGTDFSGGLYATYEFNEYLALQGEFLVGHHAWEAEGVRTGNEVLDTFYYLTIEVPILVKGMLPAWKGSVFAVAGPVLYFPMFNLAIGGEVNGVEQPSSEYEIGTGFHVGVTAGLGYEFHLGNWNLGLEGRYARTFASLNIESLPAYFDDMDLNLFVIHLFAGYRFGVKD